MSILDDTTATPIGAARDGAAWAGLCELDGRTVAFADIRGLAPGGVGDVEAEVVLRAGELAEMVGCPFVARINSVAVDPRPPGLAGLVAWGKVAAKAVRLSGIVPIIVVVTGPVHSGVTAILGLADHVIFTKGATAYLNGPGPIRRVTGAAIDSEALGGMEVHARRSGLATLTAEDPEDALVAAADLLTYLPDNHLVDAPMGPEHDSVHRASARAAQVVPKEAQRSYDVRDVLEDVFDAGSLLEVHALHAPNMVTAYARLGGRPVAIIANQPAVRAGTLDIDASVKAARHVQGADAIGLPIVTFVDTPGYEPGKDLEWRGMIRHGAKLVQAYAEATVPRLSVVLRKAYGGAYIVMDSRKMGNDLILAWPTAEIAVMGAPGAVAILNRREVAEAADPEAKRLELEAQYQEQFCSPRIAAARGYIDDVIDPADTRRLLAASLRRLATKHVPAPQRRHANGPL